MACPQRIDVIPRTVEEWTLAAAGAGILNKTLLDHKDLESGSQAKYQQFLLYRVLCPDPIDPVYLNAGEHGLANELAQATVVLRDCAEFQEYLDAIARTPKQITSRFDIQYAQQQEIIFNAHTGNESAREFDEEAVNISLVSFLQAIERTAVDPAASYYWRASRATLVAKVGERSFTAKTDGQLERIDREEIGAILECKRGPRAKHTPQVVIQEASELVAWISEQPDVKSKLVYIVNNEALKLMAIRRALISQDAKETYITFAKL